MSTEYKAVFFDLDGTLVYGEHIYRQDWVDILAENGYPLAPEDEEYFLGDLGSDGSLYLKMKVGSYYPDADMESLSSMRLARSLKRYDNELTVVDGAENLIIHLSALGIELSVVTSSKLLVARKKLERTGLAHYFKQIVAYEHVRSAKPDPEPYELALSNTVFSANQILVIEDSEPGVISARSAGLDVAAITSTLGKSRLANAGATYVFSDFATLQKQLF